jgi:uncharacterized membrane protein HdeD (DUF308 family)
MDEVYKNKESTLEQHIYKQFRAWSIVMGIGMVVLGIILLSFDVFTTFFSVMLLGILLAVRGLIDTVHAVMAFHDKGFLWRLFSGILSIVVGVLLFSQPLIGASSIVFMIAIFLISSGLFRAIAAPIEHESQWGAVMFAGIVAFVLGLIMLAGLPVMSLYFIGILVSVEIIVQGITMISLPFAVKTAQKPSREALAR